MSKADQKKKEFSLIARFWNFYKKKERNVIKFISNFLFFSGALTKILFKLKISLPFANFLGLDQLFYFFIFTALFLEIFRFFFEVNLFLILFLKKNKSPWTNGLILKSFFIFFNPVLFKIYFKCIGLYWFSKL